MKMGLTIGKTEPSGGANAARSPQSSSEPKLGRRMAPIFLFIVVVVFGMSISGHVVQAIDRLDTPGKQDSADPAVRAAFETDAGHGSSSKAKEEDADDTADHAAADDGDEKQPVFLQIPDMLVSLDAGQGRSTYVKIGFSLEIPNRSHKKSVKKLMPRIVDQCQVYLRELRRGDFTGSAGVLRVREELLRRVSHAVAPIPIDDVLLTGLVVQ
jgi:flagellar FliL protein